MKKERSSYLRICCILPEYRLISLPETACFWLRRSSAGPAGLFDAEQATLGIWTSGITPGLQNITCGSHFPVRELRCNPTICASQMTFSLLSQMLRRYLSVCYGLKDWIQTMLSSSLSRPIHPPTCHDTEAVCRAALSIARTS